MTSTVLLYVWSLLYVHSTAQCVCWSNNTGGGWAKVATEWECIDRRVRSHKLGRAVWNLESWVPYCSPKIFPQTFTKFKMFYIGVCFCKKIIAILWFEQVQTGTWWVYCSDFVLLENAFEKGRDLSASVGPVGRLLVSKENKFDVLFFLFKDFMSSAHTRECLHSNLELFWCSFLWKWG